MSATNGAGRPAPIIGVVVPVTPIPPHPTPMPPGEVVSFRDQLTATQAEHRQFRTRLAHALALSPEEPDEVLISRAQEHRIERRRLTEAAAAFRACPEGRPEHIAVRPVCRTPQCDNLVRKNGYCGKCYEANVSEQRRQEAMEAVEKWWREHVPNVGDVPFSDEGSRAIIDLLMPGGEAKQGEGGR